MFKSESEFIFMKSTFNGWYEKKMRKTPGLSEETDYVQELLNNITTIAVVGLSRNRHKDSYYVARYLQNAGYRIIPVNPAADTLLGEKAYDDLLSIPEKIDVIDVFLPEKAIPSVVDQGLEVEPKAIWLQLGVGNHPREKERAEAEGIKFIQDRCMKVDHQFLVRPYLKN